jgi:TPR repeat protein
VAKDFNQARTLYKKACDDGNPNACDNLLKVQ